MFKIMMYAMAYTSTQPRSHNSNIIRKYSSIIDNIILLEVIEALRMGDESGN